MAERVTDPTPLVGRRRELDAIKRHLETSRLVTITGVGGAGKTRLARRVTADLTRAFRDGVAWIELADVEDPALLPHTVATGLGLQASQSDLAPIIAAYIGEGRFLITLDNGEHLIEACADLVDDLLHRCPNLRVIVTSQRPLGLTSEAIFLVPPLSMPPDAPLGDPDSLRNFESVALFVERAAALQPDFRLTEDNAAAVVQLVRALDGVPLALELAAARIRVLSPEAMVERLDDRYRLLSRGFGGRVPDRQRSLEASVQWTYDLCSEEERLLWSRLAVFRGGFDLAGAEAVAGLEDDLVDVLGMLVDRSVVIRDAGGRYRMLETLRIRGEQELARRGEAEAVRRLHRDHMAALVHQCAGHWVGPDQVAWLARLRAEHGNLRAALQFSIEAGEAQSAFAFVTRLESYWIAAGRVGEARRWLQLALAVPVSTDLSDDEVAERLWAVRVAAWLALVQVDMVEAERFVDEGEWLVRGMPDRADFACHLDLARGMLIGWQGDADRGGELISRGVELHESLGHVADAAFGAVVAGMLFGFAGRPVEARAQYGSAVAMLEPCGEQYMRSFALLMQGLLDLDEGRLEDSAKLLREGIEMKRRLDDRHGRALALDFLAWHSFASSRNERAAVLLGAAGEAFRRIGVSIDDLPFLSGRRAEVEAGLRRAMAHEAVARAERRGAEMDGEGAVRFALEEAAEPSAAAPAPPLESPLTRRESEVAALVSEGLTNQQIADRLVISTRTAEAHVENILRKLGFSSRHAIAAWSVDRREGRS